MRHTTTTGIILKKRNIGEHDQFVTFFCPDIGKVEAIAKGARKTTSSFMGHLEVLNVCELQLYKTAHRYTITQCQMQRAFKNVRSNLNLIMTCFLLVEIFQKITQPEEENDRMYDLLLETLIHIDQDSKNELYIENFKIKILKDAGALPDVSHCSNCHQRWAENDPIQSDPEGHFFCLPCTPETSTAIPFKIMKLLHYLANQPSRSIGNIQMSPQETAILKNITDIFLHNYLAAELKSEKIIALLRA